MTPSRSGLIGQYLLAVLIAAAAVSVRYAFTGSLAGEAPYVVLLPALVLCAAWLGVGPALLAAALGIAFTESALLQLGSHWLAAGGRALIVVVCVIFVPFVLRAISRSPEKPQALPVPSAEPQPAPAPQPPKQSPQPGELEQALKDALAGAEAAERTRERFLSQVSHELRSPLTPLLAAARALENDSAISEEARQSARVIRENAQRQARAVDDLLEVTRLANGTYNLLSQWVDMHEKVQQTLRSLSADVRRKQLKVLLKLEAEKGSIRGDASRMQQVVGHLLDNAIKFTGQGGTITVMTSNPNGRQFRLQVVDDGAGIAAQMLPRLFNPFERAEMEGGLGLGLSICRSVVTLHGGTITARSEGSGRGATFTVTLPIGRVEDGQGTLFEEKLKS